MKYYNNSKQFYKENNITPIKIDDMIIPIDTRAIEFQEVTKFLNNL